MSIATTRTAARGARLAHLAAVDGLLAHAGAVARGAQRSGAVVQTQNGGRRFGLSAEATPGQADPAPDAPNTDPSTDARLDAIDAQLLNHEGRIVQLETQMPEPGDGSTPAEANATARAAPQTLDTAEVYARLNAWAAGPKVAALAPPMPAAIQTSAGPMLDARAINARQNSVMAMRSGRAA